MPNGGVCRLQKMLGVPGCKRGTLCLLESGRGCGQGSRSYAGCDHNQTCGHDQQQMKNGHGFSSTHGSNQFVGH